VICTKGGSVEATSPLTRMSWGVNQTGTVKAPLSSYSWGANHPITVKAKPAMGKITKRKAAREPAQTITMLEYVGTTSSG
jgi:hypothetical protein